MEKRSPASEKDAGVKKTTGELKLIRRADVGRTKRQRTGLP